jgi:hypothetical protein
VLNRTLLRREAQRQFVVRAVSFIFILSLIEGPLRKWFLPGLAGPLTLLRDPFVIALYAYCLSNGLMRTRGLAAVWLVFAVLTSVIGIFQYMFVGLPASGWLLGVRTYWLYMPLAFVVAKCFTREDVHRFLRMCLWIAIPYAFLVAAQYNSPPNAFVNLGVGADEEGAVGVADGILRPFGLFTFTTPNVQYTSFTIAIFLAFYLSASEKQVSTLFLVVTGVAVGTMSVLTGSRAIYFLAAGTLCVTVLGMLVARPTAQSFKWIFGIAFFFLLAALLFVWLFPDMLTAMEDRFERAARSEGGLWNRIYYSAFSFLDAFLDADFFGYAIGAGAPGVAKFLELPPLFLGEADTQRNVRELGIVFGGMFLLLRWVTAAWMLLAALRLARSGLRLALPLAGFASFPISIAHLTNSPLSGFLPWLTLGMITALWYGRAQYLPGQYDALTEVRRSG